MDVISCCGSGNVIDLIFISASFSCMDSFVSFLPFGLKNMKRKLKLENEARHIIGTKAQCRAKDDKEAKA